MREKKHQPLSIRNMQWTINSIKFNFTNSWQSSFITEYTHKHPFCWNCSSSWNYWLCFSAISIISRRWFTFVSACMMSLYVCLLDACYTLGVVDFWHVANRLGEWRLSVYVCVQIVMHLKWTTMSSELRLQWKTHTYSAT